MSRRCGGGGRITPVAVVLALLAAVPAMADPERAGGWGREFPAEPAPAAEQPPAVKPAAPVTEPIAAEEAVGILGKRAHGPGGEDMGLVVDVLVDADGRPRAAVIDFGGFLGVGSRRIAIDWQALHIRPADHASPVLLDLARADVQAAPEYKPSAQPAAVVQPPAAPVPAAPPSEAPPSPATDQPAQEPRPAEEQGPAPSSKQPPAPQPPAETAAPEPKATPPAPPPGEQQPTPQHSTPKPRPLPPATTPPAPQQRPVPPPAAPPAEQQKAPAPEARPAKPDTPASPDAGR